MREHMSNKLYVFCVSRIQPKDPPRSIRVLCMVLSAVYHHEDFRTSHKSVSCCLSIGIFIVRRTFFFFFLRENASLEHSFIQRQSVERSLVLTLHPVGLSSITKSRSLFHFLFSFQYIKETKGFQKLFSPISFSGLEYISKAAKNACRNERNWNGTKGTTKSMIQVFGYKMF